MVFSNPNKPFTFKPLADLPEKYGEYAEALKDRMAIIDDVVYCDNQALIATLAKAIMSMLEVQEIIGFSAKGPVNKPRHAAFIASFIVQDGKIEKNVLYPIKADE